MHHRFASLIVASCLLVSSIFASSLVTPASSRRSSVGSWCVVGGSLASPAELVPEGGGTVGDDPVLVAALNQLELTTSQRGSFGYLKWRCERVGQPVTFCQLCNKVAQARQEFSLLLDDHKKMGLGDLYKICKASSNLHSLILGISFRIETRPLEVLSPAEVCSILGSSEDLCHLEYICFMHKDGTREEYGRDADKNFVLLKTT